MESYVNNVLIVLKQLMDFFFFGADQMNRTKGVKVTSLLLFSPQRSVTDGLHTSLNEPRRTDKYSFEVKCEPLKIIFKSLT